jgi:hypothetical protein
MNGDNENKEGDHAENILLRSQINTLKQLLEVYETTAVEQSERQRQTAGELREKIKELERFNRLMVDRELKMVELKQRIKEMEGKK